MDMITIGKEIQKLRKEKRMTQEALAAEMGVTIGAVSKWETGNAFPDIPMLCALADYFGVTTDELLGRNKCGKILVCDDAPIIRKAMCDMLEQRKYDCEAVENGRQLFEKMKQEIPGAVFLDIHLPNGENGLDILKELKQKYSGVKVIIITADTSEETTRLIGGCGADFLIHKPFHEGLVFDALRAVEEAV